MALLKNRLASFAPPVDALLSTPEMFKTFAPRQATVTVFLYHVGISGELRNAARRPLLNGTNQRPPLPLELRFLVTPWTSDTGDAYRIVGAIAQLFYDHAILDFHELLGAKDAVWSPDDTVEVLMESLPVSEHYDIWEPTGIPYRLSLAYVARIVGIDSALASGAAPVAVADFL